MEQDCGQAEKEIRTAGKYGAGEQGSILTHSISLTGSPGRPKGSKNKKTIKREAEMAAQGIDPNKPNRGRGRPFGAKDSKPRKRRKKGDTTASLVN